MADIQEKQKGQGIVKPYLSFIDTNVLFKKPVSCLLAIISLLLPIAALSLFLSSGVFRMGEAKYIAASVLIILIFAFAGVFGALIWWHRRINRDDGVEWYKNFRRFIQTSGEWIATVTAIIVFFSVITLISFLSNELHEIRRSISSSIPNIDILTAFYGIIAGFIIIIATKILLFLLDPVIWLIKQIWKLIVRIVLFFYRCVVSFSGTIEKNTSFWIGVTWILAGFAVIACLSFCYLFEGIAPVIGLTASLAFMGYLLFKRKHYDV